MKLDQAANKINSSPMDKILNINIKKMWENITQLFEIKKKVIGMLQ